VIVRASAPAKVNLCLFLGPTRADGYHELVTLFESNSLADELTLETIEAGADEVVCPGVEGDNLAARALAALRARGWDGPRVRVTIDKRIPVAAGMAGGSADAAATLRLAMAIAPGRAEEVDAIAAALGADVPSQLTPGLALGTGTGELVERHEPLATHALVVLPACGLSTPAVFREADRLGLPRSEGELRARYDALCAVLVAGAQLPDELLVNDLEPAAVSLRPEAGQALADLRAAGAEHALVCGAGPSVAGIWWGADAATRAATAKDHLRDRHPGAIVATPVAFPAGAAEPA
jgi:4-diphosphocytidyl-2-C-methyl-D-erythritol kinase